MLVTSIFPFPHIVFKLFLKENSLFEPLLFCALQMRSIWTGVTFFPFCQEFSLNSLPTDIFLDWSNLKAFADDKVNVAEIIISLSNRVENIVGIGENAGYQHFLLSPKCFQKVSILGSLNIRIVWES